MTKSKEEDKVSKAIYESLFSPNVPPTNVIEPTNIVDVAFWIENILRRSLWSNNDENVNITDAILKLADAIGEAANKVLREGK